MIEAVMRMWAELSQMAAKSAAGAASDWGTYQPKEPAELEQDR